EIEPHIWIDDRPTTWKQRIVVRGQLRPDRCDREVTTSISDHAAQFLSAVALGDMVLVSDYGKGVCTRGLLSLLADRAGKMSILVDPAHGRDWSDYGPVTLIKANWLEAVEAGDCRDVSPLALARLLSDKHERHVVVTIGRHGLVCAERDGLTCYLPAEPTDVRDVCGAGDTVLASLGTAILAGYSLREACGFALAAARQQIANVGISTIATC
ncbi:MAG: PfkB family carbohydrate kinase, partial [Pirellulaceae bacterium]|nr:PfkB family carbohydrate kinase [Pirellulaceae bacterium]